MRLTRLAALRVCLTLACVPSLYAQTPTSREGVDIIPRPQSVTLGSGRFTISPSTAITADRAFRGVARQLADYLEPATGFALPVSGSPRARNAIVFRRDASLRKRLGTEGYELDITPTRVIVTAPEAAGAFYAVQSVRQLLPPEIFRAAPVHDVAWTMPAVRIVDQPRFPWRGAHLDVGRHFMPKEFVEKYIDLLALHKMNTFHWHLTEDQGWRIQIRKYPRLTQVGAWRSQTIVGHPNRDTTKDVYDGTPHGGFYTQDDIREVVAYAKQRFVTIVPEIEMPGHSQAAIAAYPFLGNFGDTVPVWTKWGVTPHILNPSDTTITFMQDVLTEVMELFPGRYIHIGGDEAPKTEWKQSPRAQAKIRALGITPDDPDNPRDVHAEDQLQSWFTTQMDAFLTKHGRRLVGWDEILQGGLAPNAVVMSWRGISGGLAAAQAGHDVVMTPGSHTYLNYYETADRAHEPLAIGGFLPIDTVYSYEPTAQLPPEFWPHILGTQAQLWTEYMPDPKRVEYMAFPRMAALAEVAWTFRARRDFADFSARLPKDLRRLDALDVDYHGRWH